MTILPAGSFRTSDYRKAIPDWVKIVCAIYAYRTRHFAENGMPIEGNLREWVRGLRFDHRPPLQDRDYDLAAKDFIPPQNDPAHIEAIYTKDHDQRTFGRKADAEKTVTTRGSDAGERKHIRKVHATETLHQAKIAMKRGDPEAIARILGGVRQKSRLRPKSRIPSRPFPKAKRLMPEQSYKMDQR